MGKVKEVRDAELEDVNGGTVHDPPQLCECPVPPPAKGGEPDIEDRPQQGAKDLGEG